MLMAHVCILYESVSAEHDHTAPFSWCFYFLVHLWQARRSSLHHSSLFHSPASLSEPRLLRWGKDHLMIKHMPRCCQPGPLHSTVSSGEDRASNAASRQAPPSFLLLPCHMWHQCQDKCQEKRIIGDARWVWESWSVWKDLLHGKLIPVHLFSGIFMAAALQRGPAVISRV